MYQMYFEVGSYSLYLRLPPQSTDVLTFVSNKTKVNSHVIFIYDFCVMYCTSLYCQVEDYQDVFPKRSGLGLESGIMFFSYHPPPLS